MAIIIGSARIDECGTLYGGTEGDQKQTAVPDRKGEVSLQNFYMHKKGWIILRTKEPMYAHNLAIAMEKACNNPNIGYDQHQRYGILKYGTATKIKTECDCSSLVRQCVKEATGKDPGDFTTANEVSKLLYTGLFDRIVCNNVADVNKGDILVTKTKGHTVIVVQIEGYPTLKKGSKGGYVKELQTLLKYSSTAPALEIDGIFGPLTEIAVIAYQKMHGLKGDGIVGRLTWNSLKEQ